MKNIFSSIPEPIQEEIFEDLLKTDSIRIERILSRGQSSSPALGNLDRSGPGHGVAGGVLQWLIR